MGNLLLRDVLQSWQKYELDDDIYVPEGVPVELNTLAEVFPFDGARPRVFQGMQYLLSFEQVRDIIVGIEQYAGRPTTLEERLTAVLHYAEHDAFPDPNELFGGRAPNRA